MLWLGHMGFGYSRKGKRAQSMNFDTKKEQTGHVLVCVDVVGGCGTWGVNHKPLEAESAG